MVLSTLLQNRVVLFPTSEPHGPLSIYLLQSLVVHSFLQSCMVYSLTSEPHGLLLSPPKPCGPPPSMAAAPRFKSQRPSSFAAPFPTPPTISYTCQHSLFFQLYWAAIVSPGRCGPMAWNQSSPTSHSCAITRGSCLPVTSWVEGTPFPLARSKATAI